MYHELGHCALNKPHRDTLITTNDCGVISIMNSRIHSSYFYQICWDTQLKELFNPKLELHNENDCVTLEDGTEMCYHKI